MPAHPKPEGSNAQREANACARAIVSFTEQRGAHLTMADCATIVQCVGVAIETQNRTLTARLAECERALKAFVSACDSAPPVHIMGYISKACDQARQALNPAASAEKI